MKVYQHVNIVTCDQDFHLYLDGILAVKDSQIVYVGQEKSEILEQAEQIFSLFNHKGKFISNLRKICSLTSFMQSNPVM